MKVDLHTHTHFSDGSISPKDLVNLALARGIKVLAITDHDGMTAVPEAIDYAKDKDIEIIPGIECSTTDKVSGNSLHIVGLYVDYNHEGLKKICSDILARKRIGFLKVIDYINEVLNLDIKAETIMKRSEGQATFVHIAMELVDMGVFDSISEAISSFQKGGEFYIKRKTELFLDAREVIKVIHEAGGVAILAHLSKYKNHNKFITQEEQEVLVKRLKSYGLDGIEVYISDCAKEDTLFVKSLAEKYNLKVSGGSDFHCEDKKPYAPLGGLDITKKELTILR